jgi:hypothetical protein
MLTIAAMFALSLASTHKTGDHRSIHRPEPERFCRLAMPDQCEGSGEWITDDPKFKQAVIKYFRNYPRHRFGFMGEATWELFWRTISGGHVQPELVAHGIYLFEACTPHSCPSRQAIVVVSHGRIIAAAMVGDLCDRCDREFYIFTKRSEPLAGVGTNAIKLWAVHNGWFNDSPILQRLP